MSHFGHNAVSLARGSVFLVSVVVLVPLVLVDYLRVVLSTTGVPGA